MFNDEKNIGYYYIAESYDLCNSKGPENVRTSNTDLFYIEFESNLQDFDVLNRNGRYYDIDNVWDVLHGERCRSMIETGNMAGELGHPIPMYAGEKLSQERLAEPFMKERAFFILKPQKVGNVIKATIKTSNTDIGTGYAKDILSGMIPQFSLRAFATMTRKDGKPYVNVKHIATYDSVLYPSHKVAHMTSSPTTHVKSVTESTNNVFENASAMIPVSELISNINDSNVEYILESFELDKKDIVGFDNSMEHAIIREDNNIIYGNLDRDTIRKVKDFYNSF